jgi:ligand-binding SRPBCC domain-containing protein
MKSPYVLRASTTVPRPRQEVFDFFARAENLGTLTPQELGFRMLTPSPIVMKEGAIIDYTIRLWMVPMVWRTRIAAWEPPLRFVDEQIRGPYKEWTHQHSFLEIEGGTRIEDEIHYRLPLGLAGRLAAPLVRLQLARIFRYREETIRSLFPPLAPAGRDSDAGASETTSAT